MEIVYYQVKLKHSICDYHIYVNYHIKKLFYLFLDHMFCIKDTLVKSMMLYYMELLKLYLHFFKILLLIEYLLHLHQIAPLYDKASIQINITMQDYKK